MSVLAQQPRKSPCSIAFLGEAPGTEEVEKGRPLVGSSGRVFDALLRTSGLDRADFWVGNVFTDKLPDNEIGNWCADVKTARAGGFDHLPPIGACGYLKPEYHHYLAGLITQLIKHKPTVVVPMGATALWAMAGTAAIGQNRGAVQPSSFLHDVKLLPTFHPAYVMRNWKFYPVVVGDIVKAQAEAARGPEVIYPERQLTLAPSLAQVEAYTQAVLELDPPLLSVDIETGWGQITCIGFAPRVVDAICIPFVDLRKPNKSYWGSVEKEVRAWASVRRLLESPIPKLGQNYGAYDAFWLLAKMGIRTMNLLHDTRLLHHAIYPELPKDLAFLGASYAQQGPWKTMRTYGGKPKRDD